MIIGNQPGADFLYKSAIHNESKLWVYKIKRGDWRWKIGFEAVLLIHYSSFNDQFQYIILT